MIINSKSTGEKLRSLRLKKGETQQELANAIGVTDAAISQYELGQRVPSDEVKIKIAKHYGRTVQFIFFQE